MDMSYYRNFFVKLVLILLQITDAFLFNFLKLQLKCASLPNSIKLDLRRTNLNFAQQQHQQAWTSKNTRKGVRMSNDTASKLQKNNFVEIIAKMAFDKYQWIENYSTCPKLTSNHPSDRSFITLHFPCPPQSIFSATYTSGGPLNQWGFKIIGRKCRK